MIKETDQSTETLSENQLFKKDDLQVSLYSYLDKTLCKVRLRNISAIAFLMIMALVSCNEKKTNIGEEKPIEVAQINYLEESKEDFDERMEWWRNGKFGIFIHWGVYSVLAGEYEGKRTDHIAEWIMNDLQIPIAEYEKYAKQFNPVKFNADEWVKLANEAGMKYIVITSKHHDGFALWDSKVSDYDIVDYTSYKKDLLKELSEACKKYNVKFGIYYSILDWHHPKAQSINEPHYWNWKGENNMNPLFSEYLQEYMKPQLKEIIDNYDPEILWFDGEWVGEYTHEQGLALYQYLRELKPSVLINNRIDKGRTGMQGMNKGEEYIGDFGTPEQEILAELSTLDWESCMTMNETWGFDRNDHNWKSTKELVFNLIDVTAKGGNYLLNVGPTSKGLIPEPSVNRLKAMGKWLAVNGEAIYNTEKLKKHYKQGETIRYTKKKGQDILYAIVTERPSQEIKFNYIKPIVDSEIYLLGSSQSLDWKFKKDIGLQIQIPSDVLDTIGETEAWVFKITGKELNI